MTFIPEKKDALYVRGVVIACGMKDDQNDVAPNKEGIRKIFTNYLEHQADVQHSYLKVFNVHQLENTLTTTETTIANQTVPVGSWIASHMVLNPSIIAMIRENHLTGYSLGAIGDKGLNENTDFLNKSLKYKELEDYDDLNPFFISFVDKASNGFVWEVMDYNQFLSKSSQENLEIGEIMTEQQNNLEDEKISISSLEKIKELFGVNKASESDDEELDKEAETDEETVVATDDISNKELLEQLPNAVASAVLSALKQMAEEKPSEDEELEKGSEEDEETDEEELDKESNGSASDDTGDDEKLDKSSNTQRLNKSSKKLDEMAPVQHKPKSTFLNSESRDELGRNKRYL